jgi:glycerol-3-phosphate dehydrogenase (NAD(P)+)
VAGEEDDEMSQTCRVGVIGGGAWGTALAQSLRLSGHDTLLWAREPEVVADINERRVNSAFLPDVALAPGLTATQDLALVAECGVVLMVAPAQHLRAVARALIGSPAAGSTIIVCAKGLEQGTGKLLCEVLSEELPAARPAVLSGPSFAAEVARGNPAAVTLAMADGKEGEQLAGLLGSRRLRIYWTDDLIGTQLGGAVKNVLAIAAGIVEGRGLGASAHAALVTRGFAELRRFAEALGARPETLMGLSGLGDLLLTCGSSQSRNMSLGRALGRGEKLADIIGARRSVAEGVYTAGAVVARARLLGVEMPVSEAVNAVIEGRETVEAAIEALMSRPPRAER